MQEITIIVYSIDELTGEAKKRAVEKVQTILHETFEPSFLTEHFKELLKEKGLPGLSVYWSLSYCQGDGVAFYGKVDIDALLACEACKPIWPELRYLQSLDFGHEIEITGVNSRYYHHNSMKVTTHYPGFGLDKSLYKVEDLIEERRAAVYFFLDRYIKGISKELEKVGYAEIEYQTSEEMALEYATELQFTKDGTIFNHF